MQFALNIGCTSRRKSTLAGACANTTPESPKRIAFVRYAFGIYPPTVGTAILYHTSTSRGIASDAGANWKVPKKAEMSETDATSQLSAQQIGRTAPRFVNEQQMAIRPQQPTEPSRNRAW